MTRLFLMRHAKARPGPNQVSGALFSVGDTPLSKRGRQQAAKMGELVARQAPGIDAVHTSPALRCRETAEIVAGELGGSFEPVEHEDLIEIPYARPGDDYESILSAIVETTRRLRDEEDPELGTGVGWQEATGRFEDAIDAIVAEHDAPLVVAHGAQNRAWLTRRLGMPPYRMFFLEQDHACLNVIGFEQASGGAVGRPALQKLNITPEPLASQGASFADSEER